MKRFFLRRDTTRDRLRQRQDARLGSAATFVGNNRILNRIDAGEHRLLFYVEADDKLITPWFVANGTYDVASTKHLLLAVTADSHCVDVGANFGYFTCLMGKLAPKGKVIGIEADEHIAALARDNVLINNMHETVQIWNAGVNDTGLEMRLFRRGTRSGNTSIISYGSAFTDFMLEPLEVEFSVRGIRIDDILSDLGGRIDFLKIDVEGAEPLVLDGAREAIVRNPGLQIIMEWSPGQMVAAGFDLDTLIATIEALGLLAYTLEDGVAQLSFSELRNLPYQSGILFSRRSA